MARIRSVHPGFFTDDAVMQASLGARLLLIGIWNECDDQGVFQWRPATLKARILPADNVDTVALLTELVDLNLVCSAELSGVKLGAVRNFCRYQRPKKPNYTHVIDDKLRTYVGLKADSTEPPPSKPKPVPNRLPTSSPKPPQREEGGGNRRDGSDTQNQASASVTVGIFERLCEELGGFEAVRKWTNLREMLAFWLGEGDFERDILPAIRESLAKRGGKLPGSPAYFTSIIRERKQHGTNGNGHAPSKPNLPLVERGEWLNRLNQAWKGHKKWDRRAPPEGWGPAPGEPGCFVPSEILVEVAA